PWACGRLPCRRPNMRDLAGDSRGENSPAEAGLSLFPNFKEADTYLDGWFAFGADAPVLGLMVSERVPAPPGLLCPVLGDCCMVLPPWPAVEGAAVEGLAVEGLAVEGLAVEGLALDGLAVEGLVLDWFVDEGC